MTRVDAGKVDDMFVKFVDISNTLLSTSLRRNSTLDDLLICTLMLAKNVAKSDIELVCLRVGDELRCRAAGLDLEAQPGFAASMLAKSTDDSFLKYMPSEAGLHVLSPPAAEQLLGPEIAHHKRAQSWHCLPLQHEGEVLGVVLLGRSSGRDYSENDHLLLNAFAARAVTALSFFLQREALERAVRAREQMLSVVVHDLKNPLNVIVIGANMLMQRFSDTSARRPVERIIRSVQRADQIIRDLVEIDAIEMGRLTLERRAVEPADLLLAAMDSQQALAAEASVIISTDISPDLPRIEADEERLHRVLENLIGNAIKFTGAGGRVTVGATRRDNDILVSVKDSGSGIAPEDMPHIFDRFWTASRLERQGTGLGLTICKGIVEGHGGRIWAESTPGHGTSLFFTIPAATGLTSKSASVKPANILLVDDRPENLMALSAILERPEYNLVTATSGEEALSLALREPFAVALIDVAMPGMNGLEVAVNLKALERSRDIPIIFITAFGNDPGEIHRAYTAGGADYLVKPLDAEIVRKKVAVFVDLSRRRSGEQPRLRT
ncbi:MAG TPA: ATP-binding protein [Candidatus Krumholzibacteria bacterium]|nr:ATP-binding protein [Candidatus Krumholzibacteria bacterium]